MWVDPGIDTLRLLLWVLFGLAGLGYVVFGLRAERMPHLATGFVLMACPFFIPNGIALAVVGTAVVVAPFVKERM